MASLRPVVDDLGVKTTPESEHHLHDEVREVKSRYDIGIWLLVLMHVFMNKGRVEKLGKPRWLV